MTTKIPAELSSTPGIVDNSDATAITITSDEEVGIGTTTPNSYAFNDPAKLVVANTSGNSTLSIVSGTTSIGYLAFADGTSGTARYPGSLQYNHNSSYMSFHTDDGTERMRITSSGNVGIGTTSPDRMLHVKGTATSTVAKFANTGNTVYIELNAADQVGGDAGYIAYNNTKDMGFWTDDTERAKIDSSGNLYFNSGFGSVGAAYGVRAWASFDGNNASGTPSGANMSSFTRTATGNFTINMSTAMPDTNYAVAGQASQSCLVRGGATDLVSSTTAIKIQVTNGNGTAFANADDIKIMVVR